MSIKIARAIARSRVAPFPCTAEHVIRSVPAEVAAALPSRLLATLYDAMDTHWHAGIAHAERAAVDEGAVWDSRGQVWRELA